jgi:hypothetical protein
MVACISIQYTSWSAKNDPFHQNASHDLLSERPFAGIEANFGSASKWIDVSISVTFAIPKKMLPPSAAGLFAFKTVVGYCVVRGSSFGLT